MKKNKGQAVVEFALSIPLFLIILFGVFDLGRVFQVKIVVINAAREAARYLAFNPDDSADFFIGTIAAAESEVEQSAVTLTSSDISASCVVSCDSGERAEVTVTSSIKLGLFGLFAGDYELAGTARMLIP